MNPVPEIDEGTKQLLTVAGLPLVDGVFATLLATNSVSGISRALTIALTIFAGAGSLAVLFSNSSSCREARRMVLKAAPFLLTGGALVGLIAPVFSELFYLSRLQYVTGAVLMLIAFKLAEFSFAERIKTHWILVPGMILSVQSLSGLSFSLRYVVPALQVVGASVAVLYCFSFLRGFDLNLLVIRSGSALILGLFSASMFGLQIPSSAGLVLFSLSFIGSLVQPRLNLTNRPVGVNLWRARRL
ncbi:MAG: DUF5794 domain-containing protein [Candidatus Nanosalina sp.]